MTAIRLWAPNDYLSACDAWQSGWGDLPFVSLARPVPALVQLGVLTHAPATRLRDLAGARRGGRASRCWGRDVLRAVERVVGRDEPELVDLQRGVLRPLERDLLDGGRTDLRRAELLALLDQALSPRAARRP